MAFSHFASNFYSYTAVFAGLPGEVETIIHGARKIFEDDETEAIQMIDAKNAFNLMNRNLALNNIRYTCAQISATHIMNIYRLPGALYVSGHDEPLISDGELPKA